MPRVFYEVWKTDKDHQYNIQEFKFIEVNVKKKLMEIPTFYFTIHRNPDSELVAPAIGDKVKIFRNYEEQLRGTILKMELRKKTIYYEGVSTADDWNYADGAYLTWKNASLSTIVNKFATDVGWTRGTIESETVERFDYDYDPYYKQLDRLAEMLKMEYFYDEPNKKIIFKEFVGTDKSTDLRFKRGVNLQDFVVKVEQDETWDKVICLGAGDGKNQLRATRGTGKKVKVFTEKSIKKQADLNKFADKKLKEGNKPKYVYYEAEIESPLYNFDIGDTVWIEDDLNRVNEPMRVMEYSLTFNKTEKIDVVFANKKKTLTDFFKKMEKGQRTLQNVQHSSAVQQGHMIVVDDEQDPIEMNVNNDNFINLDTGNSIGQVETKLNTTQDIANSAQTDATNAQITADTALERAEFAEEDILKLKTDGLILDVNGTYFLDGGKIKAGSIVSDSISADGIVADLIKGGRLLLGGENNVNGRFLLNNASGEVIADFDGATNLVAFDTIRVGSIISSSIVSSNDLNMNIHVDPSNGSDELGDGSELSPYSSISRALLDIPKFNDGIVNIYLQSNGTEIIKISGMGGGGEIRFHFQGTTWTGNFAIYACTNTVRMYDGTIKYLGDDNYGIIDCRQNNYVYMRNMKLYGNGTTPTNGVASSQKTYTWLEDCVIKNVSECIRCSYASQVVITDCLGKGEYGIRAAYGGTVSGYGTAPVGSNRDTHAYYGGDIRTTFTHQEDVTTAPPPATEKVQVWSSTAGESWRSYGNWQGKGDVRQGDWTGSGLYRGFWFFGSGPSNAVTGKTIKKMRIYVERKSAGGYSASRNAIFRTHNYTSQSNAGSGTPSVSSATKSAGFAWSDKKWVTLPPEFHAPFEAGTAKGIAIYTTSTSQQNYMIFSKSAKLEITYA